MESAIVQTGVTCKIGLERRMWWWRPGADTFVVQTASRETLSYCQLSGEAPPLKSEAPPPPNDHTHPPASPEDYATPPQSH